MIFTETSLKGAFIVQPEVIEDERGCFVRIWQGDEFGRYGLVTRVVATNSAFNKRRGTLRGMHFQIAPHQEVKLVRCTAGGLYDVIVDLRAESPTFRQWVAVELTAVNRLMLYIPVGFAHGYQTLEDNTEVAYQMAEDYHPESARGIRWDDPALGIRWPLTVTVISRRDQEHPLL